MSHIQVQAFDEGLLTLAQYRESVEREVEALLGFAGQAPDGYDYAEAFAHGVEPADAARLILTSAQN